MITKRQTKPALEEEIRNYYELPAKTEYYNQDKTKRAILEFLQNLEKLPRYFRSLNIGNLFNQFLTERHLPQNKLTQFCELLEGKYERELSKFSVPQIKYMRLLQDITEESWKVPFLMTMKKDNPGPATSQNIHMSNLQSEIYSSSQNITLFQSQKKDNTTNMTGGFDIHQADIDIDIFHVAQTSPLLPPLFIQLVIHGKTNSKRSFPLSKNEFLIGKNAKCDYTLDDQDLSEEQLCITQDIVHPDRALIKCVSPGYLTLLKIETGLKYVLNKADYYVMSDCEGFIVKEINYTNPNLPLIDQEYKKSGSEYVFPRIDIRTDIKPDQFKPSFLKIQFTTGEFTKKVLVFNNEEQKKIGRRKDCDLQFQNHEISSHHLSIEFDKEMGVWVLYQPKDTLNGTWLALNIFELKKQNLHSKPLSLFLDSKITLKAAYTRMELNLDTK